MPGDAEFPLRRLERFPLGLQLREEFADLAQPLAGVVGKPDLRDLTVHGFELCVELREAGGLRLADRADLRLHVVDLAAEFGEEEGIPADLRDVRLDPFALDPRLAALEVDLLEDLGSPREPRDLLLDSRETFSKGAVLPEEVEGLLLRDVRLELGDPPLRGEEPLAQLFQFLLVLAAELLAALVRSLTILEMQLVALLEVPQPIAILLKLVEVLRPILQE